MASPTSSVLDYLSTAALLYVCYLGAPLLTSSSCLFAMLSLATSAYQHKDANRAYCCKDRKAPTFDADAIDHRLQRCNTRSIDQTLSEVVARLDRELLTDTATCVLEATGHPYPAVAMASTATIKMTERSQAKSIGVSSRSLNRRIRWQ